MQTLYIIYLLCVCFTTYKYAEILEESLDSEYGGIVKTFYERYMQMRWYHKFLVTCAFTIATFIFAPFFTISCIIIYIKKAIRGKN